MTSTWKVHNLKLSDSNKHKYQALTCIKCRNLLLARADHIKANEIKNCMHTKKIIRPVSGPNWAFSGPVAQSG